MLNLIPLPNCKIVADYIKQGRGSQPFLNRVPPNDKWMILRTTKGQNNLLTIYYFFIALLHLKTIVFRAQCYSICLLFLFFLHQLHHRNI